MERNATRATGTGGTCEAWSAGREPGFPGENGLRRCTAFHGINVRGFLMISRIDRQSLSLIGKVAIFGHLLLPVTCGAPPPAGLPSGRSPHVVAESDGDGPITSPEPDWPQWNGPRRDGISREKGLLPTWPEGGPKLVWKIGNLGRGWSSPIIVRDRLVHHRRRGRRPGDLRLRPRTASRFGRPRMAGRGPAPIRGPGPAAPTPKASSTT